MCSIGSTLNPGHSCLFTRMRFLTHILFYLDALQKLLRNLQLCVHTNQKPCFLDLRAFAGFGGRFADFCGIFAGRFGRVVFVFCRFCAKSALNRTSRRGCGVRPAYPTLMHYSGSLKNCYLHNLHARDREGLYDETLKIIQFPWFLCVSVFDDDPQKTRRLRQ